MLGFVAIPGHQSDTCVQIFSSWYVLCFVAIPGRQSNTCVQIFFLVGMCCALWPYPVVSLIHACRFFFSWFVLGFVAIPRHQSDTCVQIFFSWYVLGFVAIPGRQSDTCVQIFLVGVCWALWPYPVVSLIHVCELYSAFLWQSMLVSYSDMCELMWCISKHCGLCC